MKNDPSTYDYILAGGGCAGLSLAFYLYRSKVLQDKKILIVDKALKNTNDRTWSFWINYPTAFDDIMYREWSELRLINYRGEQHHDLKDWRYKMMRGIDFYEFVQRELRQNPAIDFLQTEIKKIDEKDGQAILETADGVFKAKWLFNSLYDPAKIKRNPKKYHYIHQHFLGWVIETPTAHFNPACPVLFDFRFRQEKELRFAYILPFAPNKALVEFTIFGKQLYEDAFYKKHLESYIQQELKIEEYTIEEVEQGVIPMTDHHFPRKKSPHIMQIGTQGGMAKPSTGYAFLNIQRDSQEIVKSLEKKGHPFHDYALPKHNQSNDSMLLNILQEQGQLMQPIFWKLFKNNPIQRVFQFLDGTATPQEDIKVMASVPSTPFLKSIYRLKRRGHKIYTPFFLKL